MNREYSGETQRNILKVETATSEILRVAHSTVVWESLHAANSNDMKSTGNYVGASQASLLGCRALPFRNVGLCAPIQAGTEQTNCSWQPTCTPKWREVKWIFWHSSVFQDSLWYFDCPAQVWKIVQFMGPTALVALQILTMHGMETRWFWSCSG